MKIKARFIGCACLFISYALLSGCNPNKTLKLPELMTLSVTEVTQTTAKSGGQIISNEGGMILAKGICWDVTSNPTIDDFKTNDGTGDESFESKLMNLEAGRTYYLKAYAKNELGTSYGNEISFTTASSNNEGQIIADHRIIKDFEKIPSAYIAEVKKMMVWFPGESHSYAFRDGMELLEALYPTFDCNVQWGFQSYTSTRLRVTGWPTEGIGEQYWYTWKAYDPGSLPPASTTFKTYIKENYDANKPISLMGFAWCYDMVHINGPTATADPTLGVHWYGASVGGPDGNRPWGIDAADNAQTGNRVNLATYLAATEDYISYCASNGYPTKIVFTTHPVDAYTGEGGYQVYLKNEAIRNYVDLDATRILFDYADILCYNDESETPNTTTWNGHTYPIITPTNGSPITTGHISNAGAVRLAKAQWWLLARIAGWDGK